MHCLDCFILLSKSESRKLNSEGNNIDLCDDCLYHSNSEQINVESDTMLMTTNISSYDYNGVDYE